MFFDLWCRNNNRKCTLVVFLGFVCVCVCVCVCVHVYTVYEDTNLYNDMGGGGGGRNA